MPFEIVTPSKDMLQNIVDAALTIAGADMANLQLYEDGQLRIAAYRGFDSDFLKFFGVVEQDHCACGTAAKMGKTLAVPDVRRSPAFTHAPSLQAVLQAGVLSVVSIPIISSGALLGMVSTHRGAVGCPETGKIRRLEWLAKQAGRVLEGTASSVTMYGIEILGRA